MSCKDFATILAEILEMRMESSSMPECDDRSSPEDSSDCGDGSEWFPRSRCHLPEYRIDDELKVTSVGERIDKLKSLSVRVWKPGEECHGIMWWDGDRWDACKLQAEVFEELGASSKCQKHVVDVFKAAPLPIVAVPQVDEYGRAFRDYVTARLMLRDLERTHQDFAYRRDEAIAEMEACREAMRELGWNPEANFPYMGDRYYDKSIIDRIDEVRHLFTEGSISQDVVNGALQELWDELCYKFKLEIHGICQGYCHVLANRDSWFPQSFDGEALVNREELFAHFVVMYELLQQWSAEPDDNEQEPLIDVPTFKDETEAIVMELYKLEDLADKLEKARFEDYKEAARAADRACMLSKLQELHHDIASCLEIQMRDISDFDQSKTAKEIRWLHENMEAQIARKLQRREKRHGKPHGKRHEKRHGNHRDGHG